MKYEDMPKDASTITARRTIRVTFPRVVNVSLVLLRLICAISPHCASLIKAILTKPMVAKSKNNRKTHKNRNVWYRSLILRAIVEQSSQTNNYYRSSCVVQKYLLLLCLGILLNSRNYSTLTKTFKNDKIVKKRYSDKACE